MPLTDDEINRIAKAVWDHSIQAQVVDREGRSSPAVDGSGNPIKYPARGFQASTNATLQAALDGLGRERWWIRIRR